jgi:hypothetical protein
MGATLAARENESSATEPQIDCWIWFYLELRKSGTGMIRVTRRREGREGYQAEADTIVRARQGEACPPGRGSKVGSSCLDPVNFSIPSRLRATRIGRIGSVPDFLSSR